MQERIASLLGTMSVAFMAVGLIQDKWEPFVFSTVCLAVGLYLAWREDNKR